MIGRRHSAINTNTAQQTIWVKQDVSFQEPEAFIQLRILSPALNASPDAEVLNDLYVELLKDRLNEYQYPALLAGAALSLRATNVALMSPFEDTPKNSIS